MTEVRFYNSDSYIKVVYEGGENDGFKLHFKKSDISFRRVNEHHFEIISDGRSSRIRYAEVSNAQPTDHETVDELIEILAEWVSIGSSNSGGGGSGVSGGKTESLYSLRSANPTTLFHVTFDDNMESNKMTSIENGGGALEYDPFEKAVVLACESDSARTVLQSKKYSVSQPSTFVACMISALMRTEKKVNGNTVRLGYFDDGDDKVVDQKSGGHGIFIECNPAGELFVVKRNHTQDGKEEIRVAQSDWNIDQMDGSGMSGKTLHINTVNLYIFDMIVGGAGNIRVGVAIRGKIYYFHQFTYGNKEHKSSMFTHSLPVRIESHNQTGVTTGSAITKLFNADVISDSGKKKLGSYSSANLGTPDKSPIILKNKNQVMPVLSIRLRQEYARGTIVPTNIQVINVHDGLFRWRLVLNPETMPNNDFRDVSSSSIVEFDVKTTAITGGTELMSGYCSGKDVTNIPIEYLFNDTQMHSNISGNSRDTLTLVAEYAFGRVGIYASIDWFEYH